MYLKVPYHNGKETTIEEVKAALPDDIEGLTVDTDLNYPSVEFPPDASYEDYKRIEEVLKAKGFTAY